jgi:phosphoribosylaminoimidazolecarboxamide formyltransferase/IMP cyclohydrolase
MPYAWALCKRAWAFWFFGEIEAKYGLCLYERRTRRMAYSQPLRRALLSVSDKSGLVPFARGLHELGYELVSTGGTATALREAGLPVTNISEITHFPEMLEGRVKTLHPAVHGGLLADRTKPEHMKAIAEQGIKPIDLVCVNLYPFVAVVSRPEVSLEEAIENIDIGGPAMIRSAAKNHAAVTVVTDPRDYGWVLEEMKANGGETTLATRRKLAARAFTHTARYDSFISAWLSARFQVEEELPETFAIAYRQAQRCRYGENPHQKAAFYVADGITEPCIASARQLHGKELSFNNIYDLNAALETAKEFSEEPEAAAVIIKHANPCGVALGSTTAEAFRRAREGDPVSAFGGILALTRPVDEEAAEAITGKNTFFEAIIAPGYAAEAIPILTERKGWGADLRLLEVDDLRGWREKAVGTGLDFKRVTGGILAQTPDHLVVTAADLKVVTERTPTEEEIQELLFAWRVVRHVKSNAIVFTKDRQVIGVGAGQMNRVQSVRLAVAQAGEKAKGSVMASDAFFPFPDGPEAAAEAGITAIIQPGGSKKDQDTIDVCNRYGIAMVFTGVRHFLH